MKMSSTTNTTDPTDGTVSTSINATSTSTDANQRDHDNQDISVEQSDKDEAFERNDDGGEVDPHDLDNNVARTVMHSAADDEEIILTGPIELPPGAYQVRSLNYTPPEESTPQVDETNINDDIENNIPIEHQVEAYTVPDDDEQAGRQIVELQEQLGAAQEELDVARSMPVAEAVPLPPSDDDQQIPKNKNRMVAIGLVLLVTLAVVVGVTVPLTRNSNDTDDEEQQSNEVTDTVQVLPPVLQSLKERGFLRCAVYERLGFSAINDTTNVMEGIEIDFCKAVAAAVFGSSDDHYETIEVTAVNRFVTLASGEADLLVAGTTHTFERDVHESSAGMGFSFSTPYLYGGLTFNGVPEYVECADKLSVVGDCSDLRICVSPGTTWMEMTTELFPASNIVPIEVQSSSINGLIDGICNVIQGEQYESPEVVVRYYGYEGPYATGKNAFTKEPLAILTRDGDEEFADFVDSIVQSLLRAEAQNITMETADTFVQTGERFGDEYEDMYRNALGAVGNYAEMYDRHLEPLSSRLDVNTLNNGETGLLYSYPFGSVRTIGPGPIKDGVIESIIQKGFLRCGIPLRTDQSSGATEDMQETSSEDSVELGIEFCKAISASVLQRAPDNISFKSFSPDYNNISQALESGDIDVFAGGQASMSNEVRRPGLSFSKPYFYENPGEGGDPTDGKAYTLVTTESDSQWTDFVNWIIMATIHAEENNIVQTSSNEMPLISLYGPDLERVLRDTILAVGNYGEMYQRVLGQNATRVGRNMLNVSPYGPQMYPLPVDDTISR